MQENWKTKKTVSNLRCSIPSTTWLMLRVITMALVVAGCAMQARAAQPPNIVIIVADDIGYGDLTSYGGKVSTPALDRLAREGLKFTDFHVTPFCTPTRASLLTGRYNQRMPGLEWPLEPNSTTGIPAAEVTLAELLASKYPGRSIVGKWHLGRQPNFNPVNNGFTSFYGMLEGWGDYLTHKNRYGFIDWWNGLVHLTKSEYSTTAITRESLNRINYNAARNRPFFLYVPYQAVHIPYMAPGDPAGTSNAAHYAAIIQAMDRGIGQIMARVRTLPGQTLVFFLSDNGGDNSHGRPGNNGPLRDNKGTVYEGGIRVPAIAWMPGRVPAGVESDEPAHVVDILPTVAAIAKAPLPARKLDGKSLLPVFEGRPLAARRLFWSQGDASAVRDGRWKLVVVGPTTALYDLETDIGETNNVAAGNPDIVATLKTALATWKADVVP